MSRWYSGKMNKTANALAQSLGLEGGTLLFKEIQKYEQRMKQDQNWQKVKNIKKREGRDVAIQYLNKIFNGYRQDGTVGTVKHMERTPTGGDWYFYSNGIKGRKEEFDTLGEKEWYETPRYDELYDQHYESVNTEYKEFVEKILGEKLDEVETMKERLNKDRKALGEEEFAHKLSGYDIEEDQYESMQRDLESSGLDELQEMLEKLGHDEEDLNARVSDSVYDEMMEGREELEKEFETEKEELLSLTCGGHWCVSQPREEDQPDGGLEIHLKEGKDFMVLRRGGNPRIAICFDEDANEIYEVQAIGNETENLSTLDLLDLEYVPIWGFDEILDHLEGQEGDELTDLLRMRFFSLKDKDVQSAPDIKEAVERSMDDIMAIVMRDITHDNNPPQEALNYLDEARTSENTYIIEAVSNYLAEYFTKSSKEDEDLVFNIVDAYSDHYIDLMRKLFGNLNPVALKYYFDWAVLNNYEINEDHIEALQAVFGADVINKYMEDIKHPHYNISEQSGSNILAFILNGEYRNVDVNQFIRDDREFYRLSNLIYANLHLTPEGVALLNNFHEMGQQLKKYFYNSDPTSDIADKIFIRVLGNAGANNYQGIVGGVDYLRKLGLNKELMSRIENRREYRQAISEYQGLIQQPSAIEGLPVAPNNNEDPQEMSPVQSSRNWYNNGKFIRSSDQRIR